MTFDEYLGMEVDPSGSWREASIEILDHHKNPTGNVNGGVLISLADNLATGAANQAWRAKTGESAFLVGVDLHAVMLSNQLGGRVRARSTPVRAGRRLVVIRTVVVGTDDKLLAEVTTTHVPAAPERRD